MKTHLIEEKKPYPDTEAGVRAMFAEHEHSFEIERIEQMGQGIWGVYFPDGSGTHAFPALGIFEQPPISHVMKTLAPMRDPDAVLEFLSGVNGGGSARRPQLIAEWGCGLEPEDGPVFWRVVTKCWASFDRIPHGEFEELFELFSDSVPPCDVPARMKVYRGQVAAADKGLSWTLDRAVAEGFAHGHRGLNNPNPIVLEMEVVRRDVAFTCEERNEAEVVLLRILD